MGLTFTLKECPNCHGVSRQPIARKTCPACLAYYKAPKPKPQQPIAKLLIYSPEALEMVLKTLHPDK